MKIKNGAFLVGIDEIIIQLKNSWSTLFKLLVPEWNEQLFCAK